MEEEYTFDTFDDLNDINLTREDGLAEIEGFYGPDPDSGEPLDESNAFVPTAPSQVISPADQAALGLEAHDEFSEVMNDIGNLPDAPPLENFPNNPFLNTAQAMSGPFPDDPFTGPYASATPSFLAPGAAATSIFQNEQRPSSPQLFQNGNAGVAGQMPPMPLTEAPSSGDRSLMQAEMRREEDLQKSPLSAAAGPMPSFDLEGNPFGDDTDGDQNAFDMDMDMDQDFKGKQVADEEVAIPLTSYPENTDITTAPITTVSPSSPRSLSFKNAKRPRTSSPVATRSRKGTKMIDSTPRPPPAKKQKSIRPKTNFGETETANVEGDKPSESRADQAMESEPMKGIEEWASPLTELSSGKNSPTKATEALAEAKMEAPAEASKKTTKKTNGKGKAKKNAKAKVKDTIEDDEANDNDAANPDEHTEVFNDSGASDDNDQEKADTPAPTPKKKATKTKAKSKAKATVDSPASTGTKRSKSASTEPAAKSTPAKRGGVSANELKGLVSNGVLKGVRKMEASPRKTRKNRQDELDAQPNAADAVKRRRSAGAAAPGKQ